MQQLKCLHFNGVEKGYGAVVGKISKIKDYLKYVLKNA